MSWIITTLIGGLVGWSLARLTNGRLGAQTSILLGMAGALIGSYLVGFLGLRITVRLDHLVAGTVGAALMVFAVHAVRR
jgi:uncharacterized membrane protein YeaQ/YmgE (transglycosylase-associated protein family)